jgi:hypothetical protein
VNVQNRLNKRLRGLNFNDLLPDDIAIITLECVAMPDEFSEVTDIIDKAPDFNT